MYHDDNKALIKGSEQRIEDLKRENRALTFRNAQLEDQWKVPARRSITSEEALKAMVFLTKEQKFHLWLTKGEKHRSKSKADDYLFVIDLLKRFIKEQKKLLF